MAQLEVQPLDAQPTVCTPVTIIVDWDGPEDPSNPQNWPTPRKLVNSFLVSLMAFLTPLASSLLAPGVPQIMNEFKSTSPELASFVVSVYILGFAAGPLVMAPLSEIYGRIPLYHICNVAFVAFAVAGALAPSLSSLVAFRFFAGVFGSCPITNGAGTIADIVAPQHRGKAMAALIAGPLAGPVVGPIAGGFLAASKGWRWTFWLVVIMSGFVAILMFSFANETYAPILLQRKVDRMSEAADHRPPKIFKSKLEKGTSKHTIFVHAMHRPIRLLVRSPICTIFALHMAVVYGYLYLMFTSISTVFEKYYGFSGGVEGLVFLGLGAGSLIGLVIFTSTSDRYAKRRAVEDGAGYKPEYRLGLLTYGAICIPIGLFIYGWTAQYRVHWMLPILSHLLVGVGIVLSLMCVTTYMVDAFSTFAASAVAANTVVRSIGGATLPLAGLKLYDKFGVGWRNSLLGFIATVMIAVPILVQRFGEKIRKSYEIKDL